MVVWNSKSRVYVGHANNTYLQLLCLLSFITRLSRAKDLASRLHVYSSHNTVTVAQDTSISDALFVC